MRSTSFSALAFVLTIAASLAGCKGAEGDTCKENDDCEGTLMCCTAGSFERGSCGVTCDMPTDSGPSIDTGPTSDSGPMMSDAPMSDVPEDTADAGPVDAAMLDANDSGSVDVGVDAPMDAGNDADVGTDVGPVDSGPDADAA